MAPRIPLVLSSGGLTEQLQPGDSLSSTVPLTITRAQIATTKMLATTFSVSGYYAPGDLGAGAIYTSVGATSGGPGAIQDLSGTWFNIVLTGASNAGWFGVIGDYIVNGAINPTPTDNLAAFTAAFAADITQRVPAGYYYISAPLTLPRYAHMTGENDQKTHIISASDCLDQPNGIDTIRCFNMRFDSLNKGAGITFGSPPGTDYASDIQFDNCVFGNSLSYAAHGKSQRLSFWDCSIEAPIYVVDGNYLTVRGSDSTWNTDPTAVAKIANLDFGAPAGSGFFVAPVIQQDSGHGLLIDNNRFENIPNGVLLVGASVENFAYTNNKAERVCSSPISTSYSTLGWAIQVPDGAGNFTGGVISGSSFIGDLGTYVPSGSTYTPDALGILGGLGAAKCSLLGGNEFGFYTTAQAPAGGWKIAQYRPYLSDAYAVGAFVNSGAYAITPAPAVGKVGAFQAWNAALNTFTTGVFQKIEAGTVKYDTDSWYNSGSARFRPLISGKYRIGASVWLAATGNGDTAYLALYKNGTLFCFLDRRANGAAVDLFLTGEVDVDADAAVPDYYEIFVRQNTGGDLDTFSATPAIIFWGALAGY